MNLVEEGFDVGIRIGVLPDSTLRAIRVGQVRRVICAAPAYLEQHGVPQVPDDLREHCIVAATGLSPTPEWSFQQNGAKRTVKVVPRLLVNTNDGALEAARAGFGLTRLLSYQVTPQLASGELQRVLGAFEEAALPVQVIHREGRYGSAKVRGFVDLAVERLRADRALN
ncbi:MAG: LysR substrate-binding domain-containing protein [Candidatus Contendobacter sp.]|nr:LysR substrate-binding domain-containing protein [Candidatus Contendobacter sp.]